MSTRNFLLAVSFFLALILFHIGGTPSAVTHAFGVKPTTTTTTTRPCARPALCQSKLGDQDEKAKLVGGENNPPKKKGGYQFGDITKSLVSKGVSSITGKDDYVFGDITKSLVTKVTGKDDYKFGDLTKTVVANFTGKDTYEFGDISSAVLRRVQSGEYDPWDVFLALRVLLAAGLNAFTPLAAVLPVRLVLQLVNLGLAQEVGGRLTTIMAEQLDQRMKKAFTGNEHYKMGDITKEKLTQGIAKFTGKDSYEVGDISRAIQKLQKEAMAGTGGTTKGGANNQLSFAADVWSALDKLDPKVTGGKK